MSDPQDALSLLQRDLSGTDTAYPVLEAGPVDFVVSDVKSEISKKGNPLLVIKLKTSIPWKTREGALKAPGVIIRDQISLTPTENYNPMQKLAQFKEAITGEKAVGPFGAPEQYIGRSVTARIAIESSEEFGDSNRVKAYVRRHS